jgi:hypothetical protein
MNVRIRIVLALVAALGVSGVPALANQLVNQVTNQIHRLDPTIQVPPLTPNQAGHLKMILDEPARETSDFQKIQSVKRYLSKI